LIKYAKQVEEIVGASRESPMEEKRRFGGDETYGSFVYDFFIKTINTVRNYF
jgi:hypothetical protein